MKNIQKMVALIAVPVLLAGCSTTDTTSSAAGSSDTLAITSQISSFPEVSTVAVDPSKIITTSEILRGYRFDEGTIDTPFVGDTQEFHSITETQSYEDTWFVTYEVYYPQFTTEISGDGVPTIQTYYTEKAQTQELEKDAFFQTYGFNELKELVESPASENIYYYQDYSYQLPGDYLGVSYNSFQYDGGNHGIRIESADNFDLRTGEVITLTDLFGTPDEYADTLNPLLNEALKATYPDYYTELDVRDLKGMDGQPFELKFLLTTDGVKFMIDPYVYAPYVAGNINVTIPYSSLEPIIKVDGSFV